MQHYPNDVPANIDPDKYASVMAMVEECFQKYRDLPAFISMGKTLTFGQLDTLSRQLKHDRLIAKKHRLQALGWGLAIGMVGGAYLHARLT